MKKLPIIGIVVGAVAALFAMRKKKTSQAEEAPPPAGDSPSA